MALNILMQLAPLYLLIMLGFLGKHWFQLDEKSIARLAIYVVAPFVFMGLAAQTNFTLDSLLLPFISFALSSAITLCAWRLHQWFGFKDARANLSALGIGGGNTGYFGLPLFAALFGPEHLGIYILLVMGFGFSEVTIGYYVISRGAFSIADSLKRMLRPPTFYAGIAGILWSFLHLPMPPAGAAMFEWLRGTYIVLGMMIIGCTLGGMKKLEFDFSYLAATILGRHLIWPLCAALMILGVRNFSPPVEQSLWVMSLVPLAANQVAYASETNIHPEKAATAVIFSTLLAAAVVAFAAPLLTALR